MKKVFVVLLMVFVSLTGCGNAGTEISHPGAEPEAAVESESSEAESKSGEEEVQEKEPPVSDTEVPTPDVSQSRLKIKGSMLVKYNWVELDEADEVDESGVTQIVLPDSVKSIKKKAFAIKDEKQKYQPIKLEIPKDIKINPFAFRFMGPAEITFEEGRTKINYNSFAYCGLCDKDISITLPKSVKEIEPYSFDQLYNEKLRVYLNDGLEIVGDSALAGVRCDLPDSIRVIGEGALISWKPINGYKLPENLEEIGDECIFISGGDEPETPIRIPAGVKKIGDDFLRYEMLSDSVCGVVVDKKNPYFKSDANGWLYSKDGSVLYHAYSTSKEVVIPKSVKEIRCKIQLADHEYDWQKVKFPNRKVEKQYKLKYGGN